MRWLEIMYQVVNEGYSLGNEQQDPTRSQQLKDQLLKLGIMNHEFPIANCQIANQLMVLPAG